MTKPNEAPDTIRAQMESAIEKLGGAVAVLDDAVKELNAGRIDLATFQRLQTDVGAIMATMQKQAIRLPGVENETKRFNFGGMLRMIAGGVESAGNKDKWAKAGLGFEADVLEQTRTLNENMVRNFMGTTTDSALGEMVPTEVMPGVIEKLEAAQALSKLGIRTITGLVADPVKWLRKNAGGTAYYIREGVAPTISQMAIGTVQGRKRKISALMGMSEDLLKFSSPAADALIEEEFTTRLALRKDLAGIEGSGSQDEPLGVANLGSVSSLSLASGGERLSQKILSNALHKLKVANADTSKLALITHPDAHKFLLQEKNDGVGSAYSTAYYLTPMTNEKLMEALGKNWQAVVESTQLPINLTYTGGATDVTRAIVADWSQMIELIWGGMLLKKSDTAVVGSYNAFTQGLVYYMATMWHDYIYRHPESFCPILGVKTS